MTLTEQIDRRIESMEQTRECGLDFAEILSCLRIAVEALKDPENHWHIPGDEDSNKCTACSALEQIQKIVGETK